MLKQFIIAFSLSAFIFCPTVRAADEFNTDRNGYVLKGMDAVAYHRLGAPVPGKDEFVSTYGGAMFRFASAANQQAFDAEPERFAPAYGGWCAYGIRVGKKFDVDPDVFKLVAGKLYLQLDQGTQKIWLRRVDKNIAIADRLWPQLRTVSSEMLAQ